VAGKRAGVSRGADPEGKGEGALREQIPRREGSGEGQGLASVWDTVEFEDELEKAPRDAPTGPEEGTFEEENEYVPADVEAARAESPSAWDQAAGASQRGPRGAQERNAQRLAGVVVTVVWVGLIIVGHAAWGAVSGFGGGVLVLLVRTAVLAGIAIALLAGIGDMFRGRGG